jgi:hypothetical protein
MGERFRLQGPICGTTPVEVKVKMHINQDFFRQKPKRDREKPEKTGQNP